MSYIDKKYEKVSDDEKLQFIKRKLNETEDPNKREQVKNEFEFLVSSIKPKTQNHVIILLHGMNTLAHWQVRMKEELEEYPNVKVLPFSYGFYGVSKFFCPAKYKQQPINLIKNNISIALQRNENSIFSLIAHSFGSFVISEILKSDQEIGARLSNIVLCGSIIKQNYQWEKIPQDLIVLNEVGSSDIWPVLAEHVSEEYGASGTFGFKGPVVNDRFHAIKHSDYFKIEFIKKYWIPFFIYGHVKPSNWGKDGNKYSLFIERTHAVPTWFLVLLLLLLFTICITLLINYPRYSLFVVLIAVLIYLFFKIFSKKDG